MKASDVMTTDVLTVAAGASVAEAADLIREQSVTSLPVLDDEDRVVGIVSESDLVRVRAGDHRFRFRAVRDVMSEPVLCVEENADVADVAAIMLDNGVRALPIVDGGRLIGMVSRRDLLRILVRDDEAIAAEVRQRLVQYAGPAQNWRTAVDSGVVEVDGVFASAEQRHVVEVLIRSVPGVLRVTMNGRWRRQAVPR